MTRGKFGGKFGGRLGLTAAALPTVALLILRLVGSAHAQSASSTPMLKLYVDPKTKQVFTEAGKGRGLLANIPGAGLGPNPLEPPGEEKTQVQPQQKQHQI